MTDHVLAGPPAGWPALPPIGRPIDNVRAYVLDERLRLVPMGARGELFLGGVAPGRGYLGRSDLTDERFLPDPFVAEPAAGAGERARMYRTGDLARWSPAGALEFLGRADLQVKIRGFRVELGEIEVALLEHASVKDAAVVAHDDAPGQRRLVAYVVPGAGALTAGGLREALRARLPEYMIPAVFVVLDTLPLTASGKVNRRALPPPDAGAPGALGASAGGPRAAPRGPVEEALAGIYAEVLRIPLESVGAHDDFFELGGHSLLATQVASRLRASFAVDLPLRALFEAPTVAELGARIEATLRAGRGTDAPPLTREALALALASSATEPPLSFAQERIWLIDQLDPGSASYAIPVALRLRGALDRGAIERALASIAARHEVLRTTFGAVDGRPVAVVHPSVDVPLPVDPLAGEGALRHAIAAEVRRPFDLATGPLLRARLFRFAEDDHALVVTLHHIVADGWSLGVLARALQAFSRASVTGEAPALPELPIQYASYARWQRGWLRGEALDRQLAYWRGELAGAPHALDLPADRPRPPVQTHAGDRRLRVLPPELLAELRSLSRREGVTLFMTLLAALGALLHRLTGQDDVLVGVPVAGRTHAETEALIGLFINTLVMRVRLAGEPSFHDLLGRVRETSLGGYAHQDLPFERLVQEIVPERDLGRSPLFQVLFVLHNTPGQPFSLPGLEVEPTGTEVLAANFDLSLAMREVPEGLVVSAVYNTDLFDGATVDRLLDGLARLLRGACAPETKVRELPLLGGDDLRQLAAWNDTAVPYADGACLHDLFERQVERTPDAVAVSFAGSEITYRELDARANRLAHALVRRGVGPERLVGVCMDRSIELLVAIYGVLKAGGAYVPIDPEYPKDRLAYMLADARPAVILTQAHLAGVLPEHPAVLRVDADGEALSGEPAYPPPRGALGPDHLAYVIYTSGSTGRPKGAMNAHRGIVNRIRWGQETFRLTPADRLAQKTPFTFDVSVPELFWPLAVGARLVVAEPGGHKDPAYLARLLEERAVTCVHFVPSMLSAFLDVPDLAARCRALTRVFCSGEALLPAHVDALLARIDVEVHDLYGPTEAAVEVIYHRCLAGEPLVPIGRPIANVRAHVLDRHLAPVPVGVRGELYLGGVQVGRGYLGRPDLTAERFLPDPFDAASGARMYRTGDLARRRPDGEIEFLGRADFQVKVRGYRIELGDIEAVLAAPPAVRDAAVVVREGAGGDRRLCAYVVQGDPPASLADLRRHLGDALPEYMVPASIVSLAAFPLTASGKLDRRALPAPDLPAAADDAGAPRGPIEETLAGIFADVLGLPPERVGARGDFFELGGHSLLATRAVSRIRAALGVELPLRALFEGPTVAQLASRVDAALSITGRARPPLGRVDRGGPIAASFGQERLWLLSRLDGSDPSYNVPFAFGLEGDLDAPALERALSEIVRRHEVLRTTFASADGRVVQIIHAPGAVRLPSTSLTALEAGERHAAILAEAAADARAPFDLELGPLVRARLFALGEREHVLLLTLHHVVADAWSLGVLNRELEALYAAFREGRPSPLPELPIQFADYAAWQRGWLQGDVLDQHLAYWRSALDGAPAAIDLPADRPRPPLPSHRGASHLVALPAGLAASFEALARREGATLFMAMLAAFDALLFRYTGQADLVVGAPVANRDHVDTEGLLGFFVNVLVLRARVDPGMSYLALLRHVREVCLGAYAHQDVPFERLVQDLHPARDPSRAPLFQVSLQVLNVPAEKVSLSGVRVRGGTVQNATAKLDLQLSVSARAGTLACAYEYATDLFDAATIERFARHLEALIRGVVADPAAPLAALPLLSVEERGTLLDAWSGAAVPPPPRAAPTRSSRTTRRARPARRR